MRRSRSISVVISALALAGTGLVTTTPAVQAQRGPEVTTRHVPGGQVTHLSGGTGEVKPAVGEEAGTVRTPVANRSLSSKARSRPGEPGLSGIPAPNALVTTASGATSFTGINHFMQRTQVAGGNQWSLEPPDQALCVGGGKVVEAVNNAVAVYDASGALLAKDSLNHFFGYPVEINRSTGQAGPKQTTDPTCLYDPGTGRFFLTILTYDSDTAGNPLPSGHNTLDTAVSNSGDPVGAWTITHIDATDDGTGGTPDHAGCPCIGDYPHIGVDATGYYVTTNEYPFFTDGFVGAQIYAMSKVELASGASSVRVTQVNTQGMATGGDPGFTVWPAQSPTAQQYATAAQGTEYFLSTDAAEEARGNGRSDQLLTWSLTNTRSLAPARTPALGVHVTTSQVGEYAVPLPAEQKVGPVPLADCLNLTSCARSVAGTPDRYKETERPLDSLDTRMQQVTYANGLLYGSHGTAVDVGTSSADTAQQTGAAWYVTRPVTAPGGGLTTSVVHQGRLATARNNVLMPTLGVRPDGSGVIGMTLAGKDHYPGAAYADLTAAGTVGPIKVLAEGVGPEDGFAGYRIFGARPRWGDYGAAAVDASGNLWLANEWIGQSCDFAEYSASPFGTCHNTRTALANWSTRISRVPTS